jgi:hypothetical protein
MPLPGMTPQAPVPQQTAELPPAPPIEGDVPLPRERPKEADGTPVDPAALPPNSTPATQIPSSGSVPPPAAATASPVAPEQPSIFGRLMGGLKDNSATLLALGAGFAGAPNIGQGISRAAAAAIPASQADIKNRLMMQNQQQTLQALLAAKAPPSMAMAALTNPEIMKAVSAKYLETKPLQHVMIKGPLGDETPAVFDQNKGVYLDAAGKPLGGADSTITGMAPAALLAPGVKFDPNASGDDYLNQFSPDVKASVKAYMNGDVLPTGNPRQKAIATYAKTVAQRYGQDMGIPVSDALFSEKRKYRTELGSTSANSAGGMVKAFNQGIEHAASLATKLEQLANRDPLGIPKVAQGVNYLREAFSTKQTGMANDAKALGQTLAGEVGKLFSGQAGGGVHERELTRNRFNTINSPAELAGALEGTIETMEGGLKALEQRREQILGPNSGVEFVTRDTQEKIVRIKDVIKRLKGETSAPPAAATPASGKTQGGISWSIVQ